MILAGAQDIPASFSEGAGDEAVATGCAPARALSPERITLSLPPPRPPPGLSQPALRCWGSRPRHTRDSTQGQRSCPDDGGPPLLKAAVPAAAGGLTKPSRGEARRDRDPQVRPASSSVLHPRRLSGAPRTPLSADPRFHCRREQTRRTSVLRARRPQLETQQEVGVVSGHQRSYGARGTGPRQPPENLL